MSIASLVSASVLYSGSEYVQIIDDIGMTYKLIVFDNDAEASTSVNDGGVSVSVSITGYYLDKNGNPKKVENGTGNSSSYANITVSNSSGTWTSVTSTSSSTYFVGKKLLRRYITQNNY